MCVIKDKQTTALQIPKTKRKKSQQSMYTCDNIHFNGYLKSFTFDKYFFFPFPSLVYKRFDSN